MSFKARDVRDAIAAYGFEKGVVYALEQLTDYVASHQQHLRELADIQSTTLDNLNHMIGISNALKSRIENIKRAEDQYDAIRSESDIQDGDK